MTRFMPGGRGGRGLSSFSRLVDRRPPSGLPKRSHPKSIHPALEHLEARLVLTAQLSVQGSYLVNSYVEVGFQENEVATLSAEVNGQADPNVNDFHAQIQWGDGESAGDLVYLGSSGAFANFEIKGSHVYQQTETDVPINVTVTGPDSATASGQTAHADASAMPSGIPGTKPSQFSTSSPANVEISVQGNYLVNSYAGVGFQENEVATLSVSLDGQPDPTLSDLHAQINYGDDASWETGDLVYLGSSGAFANFEVKGSHVYANAKSNIPIVVYVNGPDGTSASGRTAYANISPMPSGIPGTTPSTFSASTAADVRISVQGNYLINSDAGVGFTDKEAGTLSVSVNGQPDHSLGDLHAQINFGDDASWTSGDLVYLGDSGSYSTYEITGSHIYKSADTNIPIVVYVNGPDGTSASGRTATANVAPNPNTMSATASPVTATEGETFSDTVASFTDTNSQATESDFSATITWLDGSTSDGAVSAAGDGFDVSGDHVFDEEGTQAFAVAISGSDGTDATVFGLATIADAALTATSAQIKATEGALFSGAVAAFSDADPAGESGDYVATIDWGDGDHAPGTITTSGAGGFGVVGSHTYAEEGAYTVTVTISDQGGSKTTAVSAANVADAPLSAVGATLDATATATFSGTVATFTDADPNGAAGDYSASIAWGDGAVTAGSIVAAGGGGFAVASAHAYADPGTRSITITITDAGGSQATATSAADVAAAPITVGGLSPAEYTQNEPGYVGTITLSGGDGNYRNLQVSGLPGGLTAALNAGAIVITGSPTENGAFQIAVSVQDGSGASGSGSEALTIQPEMHPPNPPTQLQVEIENGGGAVSAGGVFPIDITALGATGMIAGGDSSPATITLSGGISTTVPLRNGSGRALVPVPKQPGDYTVSVTDRPGPGVVLSRSESIHVSPPPEGSVSPEKVGKLAAAFANGVTEVLEKLIDKTIEDSTQFEKEALESLDDVAKKLGWAVKTFELAPLAFHVLSLVKDYQQHDAEQFGKDFSEAIGETLELSASVGVGIVTETNPVGAVGGLIINGIVSHSVESFYKTFLDKGMETEGQKLFSALGGTGHSVLKDGGTDFAPGAGDPPPAIILTVPAQGAPTQVSNVAAAGQALYAAAGAAYNGVVATFSDATGNADPSRYQAFIAWGDGNFTQATIAALPDGGFSVSGSNTYAAPGIYTVTVAIVSSDGSTASTYAPATVFAPLSSGVSGPSVSLLAPNLTGENAGFLAPYTFSVVYQDAGSVSASSLAGSTVEVVPPSGLSITAQRVAAQSLGAADEWGDAPAIIVTYQFAPPGGNWSAAPPGTYTVTLGGAPVTDLAGNAVALGAVGTFSAAVPPTVGVSSAVRPSPVNGVDLSNSDSLVLSGYAEAGTKVEVYNAGATIGSVTAATDGSWTFPYAAPSDGTYDFTVTSTQAYGNTSAPSADDLVEVDTTPPTSSVATLPKYSPVAFTVDWSGSDGASGSGIAAYDVYVSDNGAAFTPLLTNTFQTSTSFTGQAGHVYGFYSVAVDMAGNRQPTPAAAQTTTQVPQDANARYVAAVYEDVLGRAPDPGGLTYWTQQLDSGIAVSSVAESIAHSDEYYANFVIRPAYQNLLGRTADDAGVTHWTQLMHDGLTDQELEANLVSSAEFFNNAGGTNTAWIDAIYRLLLGRAADAAGEAFWSGQLAAGVTRLQAAERIADSTENNTQLINQDYFHYLGRSADPGGLAYWLEQFAAGKTNEDVIAGFTGSAEYYKENTS